VPSEQRKDHWGAIRLSDSVPDDASSPRHRFTEHDPDSTLSPLKPRAMTLDWQPGEDPVAPVEETEGAGPVTSPVEQAEGEGVVSGSFGDLCPSPLKGLDGAPVASDAAERANNGLDEEWWQ
jgi:hypothetical protein